MIASFSRFLKGLVIEETSDQTKQLILTVNSSATTNTSTTLRASQTSNVVLDLPNSSGSIVTPSSADTFTNKTIDGDNNTLQDIALTSLKTVLADANKTIVRDGSGTVISIAITYPSSAIVGVSDTQTLTNKDIDGGVASNSRRITIPHDTLANLNALTRKEGTIVYATDTDLLYSDDGSVLVPVGSGAAGANTALSNLTSTSINQSLVPSGTHSLGSTASSWDTGYIDEFHYPSDSSAIELNVSDLLLSSPNSASTVELANGGIIVTANSVTIDPGAGSLFVSTDTVLMNGNSVVFNESDNTDSISIHAPASLASSTDYTLPAVDGTNGQILSTNGSGVMSWIAQTASPTGDPNTVTLFNGAGNISDSTNFTFAQASQQLAFGNKTATATIVSSGSGSLAFGLSNAVSGTGSVIEATNNGSLAFGHASNNNTSTRITSSNRGSLAHGFVDDNSLLTASGRGSHAFGNVEQGAITAGGNGGMAGGSVNNGSITANGGMACGFASSGGTITAPTNGAIALGSAPGGTISASGSGTLAVANTAAAILDVSGDGSWGGGKLNTNMTVSGQSSFGFGDAHTLSAFYGQAFGIGHNQSTYGALYVGRYSVNPAGTTTSWVSTEPAFVIGNGLNNGSRANAFEVDKDGKLFTTGAQSHAIRETSSATDTLTRTDRTLLCDTSGTAIDITFPAGTVGLEYIIKDSGANAGANNITFTATGGDTFETASITTNAGTIHFQFFNGTWWNLSI